MTLETNNTNDSKPRRWFRFRLRTLLVMVTLLSVPLGWVGWEIDQRRREKSVVAWVEEMGGKVRFYSPTNDERSWWEETKDRWFGERVRVQFVNLSDTHVSDLSPLEALNNLEVLYLSYTQVCDLSPLAEAKNLRVLYLSETKLTDLSPLALLKNLESLGLWSTEVSDLSPLVELNSLEWLYLTNTQVTEEQMEEFLLTHPNCRIVN